jgi:hypothetical protein
MSVEFVEKPRISVAGIEQFHSDRTECTIDS